MQSVIYCVADTLVIELPINSIDGLTLTWMALRLTGDIYAFEVAYLEEAGDVLTLSFKVSELLEEFIEE
jgi:hypothetical protein